MEIRALRRFSNDILIAAGTAPQEADVVSEILVWCDAVGRSTQGVWRLPILTQRLKMRLFNSPSNIDIQMITNNLGKLNANNGLGHYVTYKATQHAIETAKRYGICTITISNSNYHGASGYYSSLIANADLVGIVLSNSFPKVIPYEGQTPALGTNPFSFASPSSIEQEPLLIDMATSEHAGSTIRKAEESGHKEFGQLYPFGGSKGFGLTLLVEILAGVLSGSGITHQVKSLYENFETGGNSGHFILALDISRFMPLDEFTSRMQDLTSAITGPGNENVQLPGHNRWENLRASEAHGIKLSKSTIDRLTVLADEFGLSMENYG